MVDNRNVWIGEAKKLNGVSNYIAWRIKMTTLVHRKCL